MNSFRKLKMMLMLSCITVQLSGCMSMPKEQLTVYNRRVYVDLGKYGSHYSETFTDKKGDLDKPTWDKKRVGMFCTDSQGQTDIEVLIDQACLAMNCEYKIREELKEKFRDLRKHGREAKRLMMTEPQ